LPLLLLLLFLLLLAFLFELEPELDREVMAADPAGLLSPLLFFTDPTKCVVS
jgi:hypothetical protein